MMPFTMASGIHHRLPCRWCDGVANRHQLRVVPAIQTQHLQHHVDFQIKILDCYLYANTCDFILKYDLDVFSDAQCSRSYSQGSNRGSQSRAIEIL